MSPSEWRYAVASAVGTSHATRGQPCQDASTCQILVGRGGVPVLLAVVADGAGSAARAEVGAALACSTIPRRVADHYLGGADLTDLVQSTIEGWRAEFQEEVVRLAGSEGRTARDFACTLVGAVVEPERAVFFQIGDGAIVIGRAAVPDDYGCVFWPRRGEYANQTCFVTDPADVAPLSFTRLDESIDEVALFTDGLQHLVLREATRTAHAPFFQAVFPPVRAAEQAASEPLSRSLACFLDSSRVNARTDDDKTLILATRRPRLVRVEDEPPRDGAG